MVFNPLKLTLKNGDHLPLQVRNKKCFSKTPYGRRISLKKILHDIINAFTAQSL